MVHPVGDLVEETGACVGRIGLREAGVELHVLDEGFVERFVELGWVMTVVVE